MMNIETRINDFLKNIINNNLWDTVFDESLSSFCGKNKKFYKYYSFNSPHTYPNLINDIVYLSEPLSFNDPFDCNLGITPEQVFTASQPELLHRFLPDLDLESCKNISNVLFSNSPVSEETKTLLKNHFESDSGFIELKKLNSNGVSITEADVYTVIFQKPETRKFLTQLLLQNNKASEENAELLTSIFDSFSNNFEGLSNEEISSKLKSSVKIIESNKNFFDKLISLAELSNIIIPENLKNEVYEKINEMQENLRMVFNKKLGVCCFSRTMNDILMWSHYANKHSGICVEYDFKKLNMSFPNIFMCPVIYTKKRPLIPVEKLWNFQTNLSDKESILQLLPNIVSGFVTKSNKWKYESEWRMVSISNSDASREIYLPCISKIIVGANISKENLKTIFKIAKDKNIPVEKYNLKNDSYELESKLIL